MMPAALEVCYAFRWQKAPGEDDKQLAWHAAAAFVGRATDSQGRQLRSLWTSGSLEILQNQVGKGSKVCLTTHPKDVSRANLCVLKQSLGAHGL